MLEPVDPWRRPRRPQLGDTVTACTTDHADRPGEHVALPAQPVAAGWARLRGAEILRRWDVGADTADVVGLLLSELVTNGLLHGLPEVAASGYDAHCARCGSQICVNLTEVPGAVLVQVFDSGTRPPRLVYNLLDAGATPETDFLDPESGRGLTIVANLSEEQGYYWLPTGGKVVWCTVKGEASL